MLLLPLDLLRHLFLRLSDWRHGCVDGTLFSLFWNELLIFSGAWSDADGRIWAHETEEILFVVQDQAFVDLELLWFSDQEFLCFGFHLFKPFHSLIVAAFLVVLTLAWHLASELQEVYVHPGTNLGLFEESGHDVLALSYAFTASFEVLLVHARSVLGHTSETHFLVLPGPEADEGVLVGRIRFLLEQPQERSLFSLSLLHPPLVYLLDDLNDREFDVDALKEAASEAGMEMQDHACLCGSEGRALVEKDIADNGVVSVQVCIPCMGCPGAGMLRENVREAVQSLEGVTEVVVEEGWHLPWSRDMIEPDVQ